AVGKTADFLAMPNNPLEKMSNIKDLGVLYMNGGEQERSALIQNIQIKTEGLKITEKDREADAVAEAEVRRLEAEKNLPHYGDFVLGPSATVRFMPIPMPKGAAKPEIKSGPPDRVSVSMKATAAQLRAFYASVLPKYGWTAAAGCFEKNHPSTKKPQRLC